MEKQNYNLLYLAKPIYGGWVTFTSHLSHKYESPIYKITNTVYGRVTSGYLESMYAGISAEFLYFPRLRAPWKDLARVSLLFLHMFYD